MTYNGQLCKVIASIAQGDTLTIGTNIEVSSIGNEITQINSNLSIKTKTMTITTGNTGDAVIFEVDKAQKVLPFMIKCDTTENVAKFEIFYSAFNPNNKVWMTRATYFSASTYGVISNRTFIITVYYYELN